MLLAIKLKIRSSPLRLRDMEYKMSRLSEGCLSIARSAASLRRGSASLTRASTSSASWVGAGADMSADDCRQHSLLQIGIMWCMRSVIRKFAKCIHGIVSQGLIEEFGQEFQRLLPRTDPGCEQYLQKNIAIKAYHRKEYVSAKLI